ncbi:family 1 glycosylhydrolase [Arthrobacter sp. NQ7]|uniref:family 1 glycosylhydrolase n=1 Tax=Arthrobacter sp. NQ7 TaxID=3032303 RepID=UPI0024106546|nr:family 1 glycosylhydrolase [Arthrobacter sp. NQ7]MDJ0458658.1 family 1 glycosylhydrolase [Arthrobacter sp. NQ7]
MSFPASFLWGASTAPHQIECNNVDSERRAREPPMPGMELSGGACDSYHRYKEDMELLATAGLNSYRFGIEWARIEPPSRAVLARRACALPSHDRHRPRPRT